jgi:hypothetical protein
MANATVEKLKTLGLRHGEKAGLVLVSIVTLLLVIMAWSRPSFDITADQVKKAAEQAQSNLNKPQSPESIVERLDTEFQLIPVPFSAKVDALEQKKDFPFALTGPPFVQPEPGAGLMRDMPTLIAPTELYVTAGRGAIEVFDRDEDTGEIIYVETKKDAPKKTAAVSKRRGARRGQGQGMGSGGYGAMGMGGGMGMGMGMGMGSGQPQGELAKAEAKKKAEEEAKRKAQMLVGNAREVEEEKQIEEKAKEGKEPKKVTRGYRWVALVGVLDHQTLKDNYVKALKDPNAAPHYLRVDLERQELQGETWSDWQPVDREVNELVDASFTSQDDEWAPDNVLLDGLVARLPFLNVGYYRGVHVKSLVPKEKYETPKPDENQMAGMYGSGNRMAMMGMYGRGNAGSMMGGGPPRGFGSGRMGMGMGGMGGMMGMMGGYGGMGGGPGGPEDVNFDKTDAPRVMVRALDYTVDPDTAYRYRVRIVVRNPNLGWETANPGVDTTTEELKGPWSEPLDPVRVPADVTLHAVKQSPSATKRSDAVQFQIERWDPTTGLTIVKTIDEAPGAILGEPMVSNIPKEDGKGLRSKEIDFTSRQVLVDAAGGPRPLTPLGQPSSSFEAPVIALVLRNDGQLVIRDQARDTADPEMKDLQDIYRQTIKDAEEGGKKKPTGAMMGMGGGYGRMGGIE